MGGGSLKRTDVQSLGSFFFPTVNSLHNQNLQSAIIHAEIGHSDLFMKTKILVDTGADYDVIDSRLVDKLISHKINCSLLKPERSPPIAANSQRMRLLGDVILDVKLISADCTSQSILQKIRFCVLQNLSTWCILGISTLRRLGLFVKDDRIEIAGQKICLLLNRIEKSQFNEFFVDRQGTTGKSNDSVGAVERSYQSSENHMSRLSNILSETDSSVDIPDEMKVGKSLDKRLTTDGQPPYDVKNKVGHTRFMDMPANRKSKSNRKLITDDVINEMVSRSSFSRDGKFKLTEILKNYRSVFSSSSFDVGKFTGGKAKLQFRPGEKKPKFVPVRRIPHSQRESLAKHLNEMEQKGIIKKCKTSTWNSPLFLVKKKDGSYRPVSDFRALNKQLDDIYFPIPFISDLLDSLHGTKFFSSVDLRSGFFNIVLDPESTYCTAFSALGQTYIYLRLPQGISQSPILFQQIMTEIFHDDPSFKVYLDDVLACSKCEKDALSDIKRLLQKFLDTGFLLNPTKCIFGSSNIDYLGYRITSEGWTINKSKIDDLLKVQPPTTTKEVRTFCGMLNFYLNCIPNLQRILRPLHALTGKKKFAWSENCKIAFETAKRKLADATIMAYPSMAEEDMFYLTTDASDNGWGGTLSQFQRNKGYEVPISFSSGSFTNSELNWPIKEKECSSLVRNLKLYETYLFGRPFTWRTDNRALSFFYSDSVIKSTALKSTSPKVARWLSYICEFNFSIEHHNGNSHTMGVADYLSRKSGAVSVLRAPGTGNMHLENLWLYAGCNISDMIEAQESCDDLKNFRNGYGPLKSSKLWTVKTKNGLMVASRKNSGTDLVIVPKSLIDDVLAFHHGPQHAGIRNLTRSISEKFFMPNKTRNIHNFVSKCQDCIRAKSHRTKPDEPVLMTSSKHPWMAVNADLIGPFPTSYKGNQYCLVVIDNLTRWTEIRPIQTKHAQSVADAFMKIFHVRGLPLSLLCDNGKEFANHALKKMFAKLGTNLQFTTPYRPQSNGVCERVNQKIKKLLRLWNVHDASWDEYIGPIQFLVNNEHNRVLNMSAFQAIHGWTLTRMDFLSPDHIDSLDVTDFDRRNWAKEHSLRMSKSLGELYVNDVNRKAESYIKSRKIYDKSSPEDDGDIPVGAHVLIRFPQAPGTTSLLSNWKGTYTVISRVDKNVYLVGHKEGLRRKMLIHKSRIRLLPKSCELDSTQPDVKMAVNENDSKSIKSEDQLRKDEHPTEVKVAPDCSDRNDISAKSRITKKITKNSKEKTKKTIKNHPMKLRNR